MNTLQTSVVPIAVGFYVKLIINYVFFAVHTLRLK